MLPKTPANITWTSWKAPADWRPLTPERIERALLRSKSASVIIRRQGQLSDLEVNGRVRCQDLTDLQLLVKLARDLRLPATEAEEMLELSRGKKAFEFRVISARGMTKAAAALQEKEALAGGDLFRAIAVPAIGGVAGASMLPGATGMSPAAGFAAGGLTGAVGNLAYMLATQKGKGKAGITDKMRRDLIAQKQEIEAKQKAGEKLTESDTASLKYIEHALEGKEASAYYEQDLDPEEFEDLEYDGDLDLPVDFADTDQLMSLVTRHQRTTPDRHYLDALGYGGARNPRGGNRSGDRTVIPDEVVMAMRNPMEELQEISDRLGQDSVLDHGAVASLIKTFDAKPFIKEYVDKLESSLDYLGRLLFMLFWKPKDFADMFGSDDIPQLENKLDGVFTAYGDLVLELMQSTTDPL